MNQTIVTTDTYSVLQQQKAFKDIKEQNVVFIGNPGVGKSTLLNCFMQSLERENISDKFFKSGVSIGSGLTYKLESRFVANRNFLDTPGLDDIGKHEKAAAAVTEALRKDGYYKVIFVITLEAGRVRTVDIATINLVLNYAPQITHFGLIINKISEQLQQKFQTDGNAKHKLMSEIFLQISRGLSRDTGIEKPLPFPLFLPNIYILHDNDNKIETIPELEDFMHGLPPIAICKEHVQDIPSNAIEKLVEKLEIQFEELKSNNVKMQDAMKRDSEAFQKNLDEIVKHEQERHALEIQELKTYYDLLHSEGLNKQIENEQRLIEITKRIEIAEKDNAKWKDELENKTLVSMIFNFIWPWGKVETVEPC